MGYEPEQEHIHQPVRQGKRQASGHMKEKANGKPCHAGEQHHGKTQYSVDPCVTQRWNLSESHVLC
ncbi:MAG: hypothetical protein MIO93_15620 [ANME-2 cluster archaeon]|nr:hypothetical protein [ANME-2 cluster archaeon]